MTDYTDVPQANLLYGELERTQVAISNIDAGASMTNFTIGVPPPVMGLQQPTPPAGVGTTTAATPVVITLGAPASDELMADLVAWLTQRMSDLSSQLAALGVPDAPTTPPSSRKHS